MNAHVLRSNRALHIKDNVILAATDIRRRGYGDKDDDLWICPDCGVKLKPRAWRESKEDGTEYKKTANFWAREGHVRGCPNDASARNHQRTDGHDPRLPTECVSHLILEARRPSMSLQDEVVLALEASNEIETTRDEADPHLRSERHIRPACLDYAASADNHEKLLRIDRSERRPYRDWFVRLGTGGQEVLHSRRIFYDQIRFTASIDWGTARVVVPLYSRIGCLNRRLVIDMSAWPEAYRRSLQTEVEDAMRQGAEAWRRGEAARPWLFFVGQEHSLAQVEYQVDLEAGVCAFACIMPEQQRAFRPRLPDLYPWASATPWEDEAQTPGTGSPECCGRVGYFGSAIYRNTKPICPLHRRGGGRRAPRPTRQCGQRTCGQYFRRYHAIRRGPCGARGQFHPGRGGS